MSESAGGRTTGAQARAATLGGTKPSECVFSLATLLIKSQEVWEKTFSPPSKLAFMPYECKLRKTNVNKTEDVPFDCHSGASANRACRNRERSGSAQVRWVRAAGSLVHCEWPPHWGWGEMQPVPRIGSVITESGWQCWKWSVTGCPAMGVGSQEPRRCRLTERRPTSHGPVW